MQDFNIMFGKKKNKESKEKKPFKETKIGAFANKVAKEIPSIALDVLEVATSPNPLGATLKVVKERLEGADGNSDLSIADKAAAESLLYEFKKHQMDFEAEVLELEVKDRDSARNREIEIAKIGKKDFMQPLTGLIGLGAFIYIIYAVINIPGIKDNHLAIHIIGLVEGVVLSIFYYYYGTSKGSKDKDDIIKGGE